MNDQSVFAYEKECKIYNRLIKQNNLDFKLKVEHRKVYIYRQNVIKENVVLTGDNLITYKQMYKAFNHKDNKRLPENAQELAAYLLLPRNTNGPRVQINSKRATVIGYYDNPFAFFHALCEGYKEDFSEVYQKKDKVKEMIVLNKEFFKLFGEKENGFEIYMNCFALDPFINVKEKYIVSSSNYKKMCDSKWNEYRSCLEQILVERKELFDKLSEDK